VSLPNTIRVGLKDHAMMTIDAEAHQIPELREYFSFYVPGHKFMPAFKSRKWDGKIKLFNQITRELNVGLYAHLKKFCADRMYPIELIDNDEYGHPENKNHVQHQNLIKFQSELDLPFPLRDYQYDAVTHGIKEKRAILLSPTGSGKSFIIYNLMRWYMENFNEKILIVVPTTSLVEQMHKDFEDYGFDPDLCHKIYSGKEKVTDKQIIISTWQSIYKFPKEWFEQFGCVFGDEVHLFKAKSLSGIMNKCSNAAYRFGTTGTLDGTETNKLVLEGLFGPTKRVTATRDLQVQGTLAQLDISVLLLRYHNDVCHMMQGKTYQEEMDYIVTHEKRNKLITNLALDQKGNTLVLFQFVEKHGKILFDMMRDKAEEGRKIFYVSGEVDAADREQIRGIVEKQKNAIIVASLGTFSTGINIRNLHNIVFASPSKSQVKVLQSIGRGLRQSDDGSVAKLYDIADDMHIKSHKNFTLRHSAERIKIYTKEQFPYKIHQINLK
jgi:superfamily II DNA or RNA helicase